MFTWYAYGLRMSQMIAGSKLNIMHQVFLVSVFTDLEEHSVNILFEMSTRWEKAL